MDFQIPAGLTELMQDFTVLVLREKPIDLVDFAADYFTKLKEAKKQYGEKKPSSSKGVKFLESYSSSDDEEPGKVRVYILLACICCNIFKFCDNFLN